MSVRTPERCWVVSPDHAIWVPPAHLHATSMLTNVRIASLHLQPSSQWKHVDCRSIEVTPLLRQLILAVAGLGPDRPSKRDELVVQLIEEELRAAPDGASPIPAPRDPRLVQLCRLFLSDPGRWRTLEELSRQVGGCSRTMARLFARDLGMSFRQWRELVQVENAIAHLAQGRSIKVVASMLDLTPSAFTVMLRRSTGGTPRQLQRHLVATGSRTHEA
jgi:AraC-like DNA-binding protein